jgi:RNA polymerase sigma-70 factor (ECF subfamily)
MPQVQTADSAQPSDADLMARLVRRDMDALAALYARHAAAVEGFLRRLLGPHAPLAAPDLCHEVFLGALERAGHYQEQGKTRAWLMGIAAHKAHEHLRGGRRRRILLAIFGRSLEPVGPPALAAVDVGLRGQLGHAINGLPPEQRLVLLLHAVEGWSAEQIAHAMGIRPATVWTRLHRARQALRKSIPVDPRSPSRSTP